MINLNHVHRLSDTLVIDNILNDDHRVDTATLRFGRTRYNRPVVLGETFTGESFVVYLDDDNRASFLEGLGNTVFDEEEENSVEYPMSPYTLTAFEDVVDWMKDQAIPDFTGYPLEITEIKFFQSHPDSINEDDIVLEYLVNGWEIETAVANESRTDIVRSYRDAEIVDEFDLFDKNEILAVCDEIADILQQNLQSSSYQIQDYSLKLDHSKFEYVRSEFNIPLLRGATSDGIDFLVLQSVDETPLDVIHSSGSLLTGLSPEAIQNTLDEIHIWIYNQGGNPDFTGRAIELSDFEYVQTVCDDLGADGAIRFRINGWMHEQECLADGGSNLVDFSSSSLCKAILSRGLGFVSFDQAASIYSEITLKIREFMADNPNPFVINRTLH